MNRHLKGWRKDKRDERDYLRGAVIVKLPPTVDLSAYVPSVRDQGNLGSCTGFGIGGNLTGCAIQQGADPEWRSPTWIYNGGRLIDGCLAYDAGAYPRDCLEFIRENGCLLEHFRPYRDTLDKTSPLTWGLGDEAAKWPIISYTRLVDGVDGIKGALASGYLVSLGTPWFWSWDDTDSLGIMSSDYTSVAGGHEYLCYGYDDALGILYCQNSWGMSWGKAGRFAIRYSAIPAFKSKGGYDAHIVTVDWGTVEPPPPPPDPDPVVPQVSPVWIWILLGALGLGGAILLLKSCL